MRFSEPPYIWEVVFFVFGVLGIKSLIWVLARHNTDDTLVRAFLVYCLIGCAVALSLLFPEPYVYFTVPFFSVFLGYEAIKWIYDIAFWKCLTASILAPAIIIVMEKPAKAIESFIVGLLVQ